MTPGDFSAWLAASPPRRPLVMGILNVTPDSFSDGNRHADAASALAHAEAMATAGADLIDIGGESTRPGAERIPIEEQLRRVLPVLREMNGRLPIAVSIDTTRAAVAAEALSAGASIINDISGGTDDAEMLPLAARRAAPIVLMHMRKQPKTMQIDPQYGDVVEDIKRYLAERVDAAVDAGVRRERVMLDPGIGFGKTLEHDLELLRRLEEFQSLGRPLLLGVSRKKFIGRITGDEIPAERVFGTAAALAWCVSHGAGIVRVHDVASAARVVKITRAIQAGWTGADD